MRYFLILVAAAWAVGIMQPTQSDIAMIERLAPDWEMAK